MTDDTEATGPATNDTGAAGPATDDTGTAGGISGKKLAVGAVVALGVVVLAARALRGGGSDEPEAESAPLDGTGDGEGDDTATEQSAAEASDSDLTADATGALPVDADVEGRFDEIDIVDAVYILVAGLKAAREEYRQRIDEGGA
ncbi:MAG: hypothetical protein ABEJ05_09130 [Haloglomus sp.]